MGVRSSVNLCLGGFGSDSKSCVVFLGDRSFVIVSLAKYLHGSLCPCGIDILSIHCVSRENNSIKVWAFLRTVCVGPLPDYVIPASTETVGATYRIEDSGFRLCVETINRFGAPPDHYRIVGG